MNTGVEAWETSIKLARRWGYDVKRIPDGQAKVVKTLLLPPPPLLLPPPPLLLFVFICFDVAAAYLPPFLFYYCSCNERKPAFEKEKINFSKICPHHHQHQD